MSEEKIMKNNACRKDIANRVTFSRHILYIDDLWSHKSRSTTPYEQVSVFICISGQTEITNGQILRILFSKHYVLWLEITVNDPIIREMR